MPLSTEQATTKIGLVEVLIQKRKDDQALEEISKLIDELCNIQNLSSGVLFDVLITACIKRIAINHKKEKYEKIVSDINLLEKFGYDIYMDEDILMKQAEAEAELNKTNMINKFNKFKLHSASIEAAKINTNMYFDIDKMFSRKNPISKRRKN